MEVEFMKSIAQHITRLYCFVNAKKLQSLRLNSENNQSKSQPIEKEKKLQTAPSSLQLQILAKKPKKPTSSFVFYFQEQVRSKNHPSNQREIDKLATIVSKQWKELPQQVKDPYQKMASKSKQKYRIEMDKYQSLYGDELANMKRQNIVKKQKLRKIGRFGKKRQPIISRVKSSATQSIRSVEQLTVETPIISSDEKIDLSLPHENEQHCDVWHKEMNSSGQKLTEEIATAKSAEITKQNEEDAKEDGKKRTQKSSSSQGEMNSIDYQSSETYIEGQQVQQEQSGSLSSEYINLKDYVSDYQKQRRERKPKISHKPKGPATCFFIFYNEIVQNMKKKNSSIKGSEYAKIASDKWTALSNEEKQPYREMEKEKRKIYDQEMAIFMKEYPEEAAQTLQEKKDRKMKKKAKLE